MRSLVVWVGLKLELYRASHSQMYTHTKVSKRSGIMAAVKSIKYHFWGRHFSPLASLTTELKLLWKIIRRSSIKNPFFLLLFSLRHNCRGLTRFHFYVEMYAGKIPCVSIWSGNFPAWAASIRLAFVISFLSGKSIHSPLRLYNIWLIKWQFHFHTENEIVSCLRRQEKAAATTHLDIFCSSFQFHSLLAFLCVSMLFMWPWRRSAIHIGKIITYTRI